MYRVNKFVLLLSMIVCLTIFLSTASAQYLLVPMEQTQTNHLKAYGLIYWGLEVPREYQCFWWLNYRGGSFVIPDAPGCPSACRADGCLN